MVRTGFRHQLYNLELQKEVENRAVSPSIQVLPANHPSYEYLLLAPLTLVSYRAAYWLWLLVNLVVVGICANKLSQVLDPWLAVCLVFGFIPTACALFQGQDSLWMLLVFLLAWRAESDVKSGFFVGLSVFRFHVLIPVLLLYLLWRKWNVLMGFLLSAAPAALISVALVGISGSLVYIREASSSTEVRNGPLANVYGLCQAILGHTHVALALALLTAVISLGYTARRKEPSIATAALLIPLTTMHLQAHDLVVLLIPIAAELTNFASLLQFVVAVAGWFPPLAFLSGTPSALMLLRANCSNSRTNAQASAVA